jgi:hypothetical protein
VDRPEQFVEELNPRAVARGVFRLNAHDVSLCGKCQAKQEQWLLHGREAEQTAPLCPDCAFAVREAVGRNAVHAKTRYLAAAIASTRDARGVKAEHRELGTFSQVALIAVLLASLLLLSLSSLSTRVGALWFFGAEVNVATELIAVLMVDLVLSFSVRGWRGWWVAGSAAVLVVPLGVRMRRGPLFAIVACVWVVVLVAVTNHALRSARQRSARELERQKLKQMDEPPVVVPRNGGEAEEEEDDPFQLGVPGRGWSSRRPAFDFRPGEYEPGAMVLGAPPPKPPSSEELAVESLLSSISIVSPESEAGPGVRPALVRAGMRIVDLWRQVPRMTLGSIAVALSCRIVFLERAWSTRVYAAFLALAAVAILVETSHRFKRHLSGALWALAVTALLPWQSIWEVVWSQVELLLVAGVAVALFLLRNSDAKSKGD